MAEGSCQECCCPDQAVAMLLLLMFKLSYPSIVTCANACCFAIALQGTAEGAEDGNNGNNEPSSSETSPPPPDNSLLASTYPLTMPLLAQQHAALQAATAGADASWDPNGTEAGARGRRRRSQRPASAQA